MKSLVILFFVFVVVVEVDSSRVTERCKEKSLYKVCTQFNLGHILSCIRNNEMFFVQEKMAFVMRGAEHLAIPIEEACSEWQTFVFELIGSEQTETETDIEPTIEVSFVYIFKLFFYV